MSHCFANANIVFSPNIWKAYILHMPLDHRFNCESFSSPLNKHSCLRAERIYKHHKITRLYVRAEWKNLSNVPEFTVTQWETRETNLLQLTNSLDIYIQTSTFFKLSSDCWQKKPLWAWQASALQQSLTIVNSCASVSFLVCNYQLYWSST